MEPQRPFLEEITDPNGTLDSLERLSVSSPCSPSIRGALGHVSSDEEGFDLEATLNGVDLETDDEDLNTISARIEAEILAKGVDITSVEMANYVTNRSVAELARKQKGFKDHELMTPSRLNPRNPRRRRPESPQRGTRGLTQRGPASTSAKQHGPASASANDVKYEDGAANGTGRRQQEIHEELVETARANGTYGKGKSSYLNLWEEAGNLMIAEVATKPRERRRTKRTSPKKHVKSAAQRKPVSEKEETSDEAAGQSDEGEVESDEGEGENEDQGEGEVQDLVLLEKKRQTELHEQLVQAAMEAGTYGKGKHSWQNLWDEACYTIALKEVTGKRQRRQRAPANVQAVQKLKQKGAESKTMAPPNTRRRGMEAEEEDEGEVEEEEEGDDEDEADDASEYEEDWSEEEKVDELQMRVVPEYRQQEIYDELVETARADGTYGKGKSLYHVLWERAGNLMIAEVATKPRERRRVKRISPKKKSAAQQKAKSKVEETDDEVEGEDDEGEGESDEGEGESEDPEEAAEVAVVEGDLEEKEMQDLVLLEKKRQTELHEQLVQVAKEAGTYGKGKYSYQNLWDEACRTITMEEVSGKRQRRQRAPAHVRAVQNPKQRNADSKITAPPKARRRRMEAEEDEENEEEDEKKNKEEEGSNDFKGTVRQTSMASECRRQEIYDELVETARADGTYGKGKGSYHVLWEEADNLMIAEMATNPRERRRGRPTDTGGESNSFLKKRKHDGGGVLDQAGEDHGTYFGNAVNFFGSVVRKFIKSPRKGKRGQFDDDYVP